MFIWQVNEFFEILLILQNFGTWASWGDYGKSRFLENPVFSNFDMFKTFAKDTENSDICIFGNFGKILELGGVGEITENRDFRKVQNFRIMVLGGQLQKIRKIWKFECLKNVAKFWNLGTLGRLRKI